MGFLGPVRSGMIEQLEFRLDQPRQRGDGSEFTCRRFREYRGGRYAPRAIARGVGDLGGPQAAAAVDAYLKTLTLRPVVPLASAARQSLR